MEVQTEPEDPISPAQTSQGELSQMLVSKIINPSLKYTRHKEDTVPYTYKPLP